MFDPYEKPDVKNYYGSGISDKNKKSTFSQSKQK